MMKNWITVESTKFYKSTRRRELELVTSDFHCFITKYAQKKYVQNGHFLSTFLLRFRYLSRFKLKKVDFDIVELK